LERPETKSRCVVLTSFSNKVFSAGADLKERATMSQDQAAEFVTLLRNTMERLAKLPIPVIASVEGVAVGGGLEIALAADLRVASKSATFGLPETSLAIIPGAGGTQRLPRLIGVARAKELIWTGRRISAEEAYEYGLVHAVVEPGEALSKAMELSWKIAQNGPVAIRASKTAVEEGLTATTMADALEIERQNYARVLPTSDRLEGLAAFKESRTPKYTGQ
jgi:enoyl-CoA hydratase/carnithine racemase